MAPDEIAVYYDGGLSMLITVARAGPVMEMISGLQYICICLDSKALGSDDTSTLTLVSSPGNLYRAQGKLDAQSRCFCDHLALVVIHDAEIVNRDRSGEMNRSDCFSLPASGGRADV